MLPKLSAKDSVPCLLARWQHDGLPAYAQFDNDTVFQGAHQFADAVGRISRLCLALEVIPVFVPPLEHGMQNLIEGFNGLWQAKVWQFAISPDWPHRLVRCEVAFDHHCIRCFALRRRAPTEQPLLTTIAYHRTDKPFYGEL